MTIDQEHSPGWYPDPSGRHELRYFSGQWTQHVCTRGVNSIDPLAASPAPAASTPLSNPVQTPWGPAGQRAPGTLPDAPNAASTRKYSPRCKIAIGGGVIAVAVGTTLAIALSGGGSGSGGHGFCTDVAALGNDYPSQLSAADLKNVSKLSHIASQFDTIAAETSSAQNAADLHQVASWLRKLANGNYAGAQAGQAQLVAAGDRVDTYIDETCPGLSVSGG